VKVAVLDGGGAGAGGVKPMGAMTLMPLPFVCLVK
jgi:hypothetical protein